MKEKDVCVWKKQHLTLRPLLPSFPLAETLKNNHSSQRSGSSLGPIPQQVMFPLQVSGALWCLTIISVHSKICSGISSPRKVEPWVCPPKKKEGVVVGSTQFSLLSQSRNQSPKGSKMAESRTEEVISTSNPTVEVIEEMQPDGTVLRKKKTTRTITKRVLSTSTKESETGSSSTITSTSSTSSTSSGSSSSGVLISSESSLKEASGETTSKETNKETTTETTAETKENEDATKSEASSKKTFKYKVFGEGDSQSHPFYRFLARFPLKSLPAQHQRPSPIKPVLYAYAPGWKLNRPKEAKESKESTEATEASEEKKDDLPATGSFDVDSLKWMVTSLDAKDLTFDEHTVIKYQGSS